MGSEMDETWWETKRIGNKNLWKKNIWDFSTGGWLINNYVHAKKFINPGGPPVFKLPKKHWGGGWLVQLALPLKVDPNVHCLVVSNILMWFSMSYIPWLIHGAAIYGNMDPMNIPQMLAYIPYMDPMGIYIYNIYICDVIRNPLTKSIIFQDG